MNYSSLESEYLIKLVKSAIRRQSIPEFPDTLDFDALLELANHQQVFTMVYEILSENGVLTQELEEKYKVVKMSEFQKFVAINSERDEIARELEENGIDYMFLKGIIAKKYYPRESMRQMSDNDILYKEEARHKLVRIMKSRGYYIGAAAGISDDFYKKPFCTFEFHRTLFNPEEEFCPEFDPWQRASLKDGTKHCYVMNAEDNYIYTMSHLYKHYYCIDGCGIRFLCDLYLLKNSGDNLNFEYIQSVFTRFGILDFSQTADNLAEAIFGHSEEKKENRKQQLLLDFMLSGGVYGYSAFDIEKELEKYNNSKFRYLLHRLFPSVKSMKGNYKVLEKHIYLLPILYVFRFFDKYKHNRRFMDRDINALKNSDRKK